ncbi:MULTISPECIES: SDR family oxidoreductase [Sphingomonas]|uniref:SDR family oxidoreductase n=1 Tax=Sphingomonas TaxID=13687 RepID=UPI000830DC53|nr:SDR family NAD(P)-dependent oxidoreductase [Sphingomonas sp. CCH10-B3]
MKLEGKRALVTGGTDGIGLALARELRGRGVAVMVCGRTPDRLESARAEGLEAVAADLATDTGRDTIVNAVHSWPIDILVNNAGIGAPYDIGTLIDLGEIDRAIALNLTAPIHLVTRLIGALRERPEAMIVNVTSGLAIAPNARSPVYCATKAGLRSFTQSLRAQLSDSPISVLEVLPPVVDTAMTADNPHRKMAPEACAREIAEAIAAGRSEAHVGMVKLLNGVHNLAPAVARRVMLRY